MNQASKSVQQPRDRWTALVLMSMAYGISSADRILMSIFVEPVKQELGLSDAGVGFLTATVFAIFYVGGSIPLGVLSDRSNRRSLLAGCTALFSVMTAFTGLATSYLAILISRVGVAVGEAGCTPLAVALLADKFAPARRYAVMTLFTLGVSIGAWIGATGGGYLQAHYGWRGAMIIFGLAGLPIALMILLFVREPERGALDPVSPVEESARPTIRQTLRVIMIQRSVLHLMAASFFLSFWGWGLIWWAPAYLSRSFGVSTADAGAITGTIHGVSGTIVVLLAALALVPLGRGDPRRPLWCLSALALATTIPSIVSVFARSQDTVILMLWLYMPMAYVCIGPMMASVTSAVPSRMRGLVTAIFLGIANFSALAVAPQVVGMLSDFLASRIADPAESLRYALIPVALSGFLLALHLLLSARHVNRDFERLAQLG